MISWVISIRYRCLMTLNSKITTIHLTITPPSISKQIQLITIVTEKQTRQVAKILRKMIISISSKYMVVKIIITLVLRIRYCWMTLSWMMIAWTRGMMSYLTKIYSRQHPFILITMMMRTMMKRMMTQVQMKMTMDQMLSRHTFQLSLTETQWF